MNINKIYVVNLDHNVDRDKHLNLTKKLRYEN